MKNKRKLITAICFALAAVLLMTSITLAAYTSLSSVKRVVTVKGTEQLFTSNILSPYDNEGEIQTRIISFAENSERKAIDVEVANYIQGDATKFDAYSIPYTLNIEIVDASGNRVNDAAVYGAYKVQNSAMTENPYTDTANLPGGYANKKTYKIEVPSEYLSSYRIKVTAVPTGNRYKSIGRFLAMAAETISPHWAGKFLDSEAAAVSGNKTLGIINYTISGHVEETCSLSWDSSRVEIDPWFLQDMHINANDVVPDSNGIKTVTLTLGAEGKPGQYDIQFYRTYAAPEAWDDITGYITFKNSKED